MKKQFNPNFFRRKLNKIIIFIRKYDTLTKVMLFVFNLQIRRQMIKYISKNFNNNLIGAEIGTFEGENALNMLSHLSIKHLFLIDSYIEYNEYDHTLGKDVSNAFDICQKRLFKFNEKITFIKKKSSDAIDNIPDNLDFVYIDGNHAYKYVKSDINLYYPKVKKGGVIGGHDIQSNDVQRAVTEFSEQNNLKVYKKYPDWWIIKN